VGAGTAAPSMLGMLSGMWHSLGGGEFTAWWNALPEVEAQQLKGYIEGLWEVMEGRGFDHVFHSEVWAPPLPSFS